MKLQILSLILSTMPIYCELKMEISKINHDKIEIISNIISSLKYTHIIYKGF